MDGKVAVDEVVDQLVFLHFCGLHSAIGTILLLLEPVRQTAAAESVHARHHADCLVHDQIADTTFEMVLHDQKLRFHLV